VRMSPTTSAPVRWRLQWSAEVLFPWLAPWLPPSQLGRHPRTDPRGAEVGGWASRLVLRRGQRGIGQGVPHDVATAAAAVVVQAWQAWAPDAPDELDATLRLTAASDGERPDGVDVVGSVLGGEADAAELLGESVDRVGVDPVAASRRHMPHRAAKRYLEGLGSVEDRREQSGPEQPPRPDNLYTKSESSADPCQSRRSVPLSSTSPRGWPLGSRER
jgi:hypothetical protein